MYDGYVCNFWITELILSFFGGEYSKKCQGNTTPDTIQS